MGSSVPPSASAPTSAAAGSGDAAPPKLPTQQIIAAMVHKSKQVSDLIFSVGSLPLVELNGQLVPVELPGLQKLKPADTGQVANDLIGTNKLALQKLRDQGSCDISYSLPNLARFRVNIFVQRGTYAIVMRVIPTKIPVIRGFESAAATGGLRGIAQRRGAGDRAHRIGKILDAGRDFEPDQPGKGLPHHHHRRSRSNSCTATRNRLFTSANCTAILPASRWLCARRCARRRK